MFRNRLLGINGVLVDLSKRKGALSSRLWNRVQQDGGPFRKSVSKLDDADYSNVLLASFDRAHVVAVQLCQLGELLLRQSLR